jgi:prepilin-type N-terminal cleavage/methylation domain-containing protein
MSGRGAGERQLAFTLIELLVVISIIGILAALVIPLSGIATTKMRLSRTQAELNNYVTAIETYKLEVGFYPPDNGKLKGFSTNGAANFTEYRNLLALNPLFYELVGCVFTNQQFYAVAGDEIVRPDELKSVFNVTGIQNSQRHRADVPFKGFRAKPSMYAELGAKYSKHPGADVEILAAPVPGPLLLDGKTKKINPWFYDSSTTNRHNRTSYDLWAEITAGGRTHIIGNWKN